MNEYSTPCVQGKDLIESIDTGELVGFSSEGAPGLVPGLVPGFLPGLLPASFPASVPASFPASFPAYF